LITNEAIDANGGRWGANSCPWSDLKSALGKFKKRDNSKSTRAIFEIFMVVVCPSEGLFKRSFSKTRQKNEWETQLGVKKILAAVKSVLFLSLKM
jgi:hypothetical protein